MPIYEWACPSCKRQWEEFFRLDDKPDTVKCFCGAYATQVYYAPAVMGDCGNYARRRFPYYDESLDKKFTSLSQKNQYLKANDIRIRERGEKVRARQKAKVKDPNLKLIRASSKAEFQRNADEFVKERIAKTK